MATPEIDIVPTELWTAVMLRDAFGYRSLSLTAKTTHYSNYILFHVQALGRCGQVLWGHRGKITVVTVLSQTLQLCAALRLSVLRSAIGAVL